MSMRQIRLEAAHRELGSRHPWLTILGRRIAVVFGALGLAVGLYLVLRAGWHAVSGWMTTAPSSSQAPVSHPVSVPVSWMPLWGWVVLALLVLVVALRYVPRIRFRMKWGIWSSN